MSKEVKVLSWCDGDHLDNVEATLERTVSIDGGKPVLLDLCETCDKVFADLAELMERGVYADTKRPHRAKPRPNQSTDSVPFACPECGRVGKNNQSLGAHRFRAHGIKTDGSVVTPPSVPANENRPSAEDLGSTCKEPGCIDPRTSKRYVGPSRSALGQHVRSAHGKTLSDYKWSD